MHVSFASATDTGMRRSINEDSLSAREDLGLFVVADGMGGHVGGEVASQLAVEAIQAVAEDTTGLGPEDNWPSPFDSAIGYEGNRLRAGFNLANRRIAERVSNTDRLRGMATTAVAVLVDNVTAALAHVGDSRAYLLRSKRLTRLTRDHSWVEEQVQAGTLTAAAARDHPWRNVVTRALSGGELDVEVVKLCLQAGDRVLLCSDGLSAVLTDEEIGEVISSPTEIQTVCDELVERTNAKGGPDNVTVLILDIHNQ